MTGVTLMQNVYNRTKKPNQSPAAGGFDSGRRSSGVSARWLLMQSIKSRRKRYKACDDVVRVTGVEPARLSAREPKGYVTLVKDFQSPPYHKGRASFPTLQKIFRS